jgi:hypothetical protein
VKSDKPVPITAVWLYRSGDRVRVSVEIDGQLRLAIEEVADGNFSHCCEGAGLERAPIDTLLEPKRGEDS